MGIAKSMTLKDQGGFPERLKQGQRQEIYQNEEQEIIENPPHVTI